MARVRSDQPLVASVLDRLIDDAPEQSSELARNRTQILRELQQAVRRDIENLLNTRRRAVAVPTALTEVQKSLFTYGLPDFSGSGPSGGKDREAFARQIEEVIRRNEPRLLKVAVELLANPETGDRTLRFRIDALMRADPAPEPVSFDSTLEPATGSFAVSG